MGRTSSLSDIPFNESLNDFGTERYVNGLIKFIENSSAPITIALQGEWGSGKTSLMNRLERVLCTYEDSQFVGIGINTWEYSMLSSPEETVFKIIERLVKELSQNDGNTKKTWNKYLKKIKHATYRGLYEGVKMIPGMAIAVGAANVPSDYKDKEEIVEDITLSDLRVSLETAVNNLIATKNKKGVIVFVDDLDRLNPPVAVEILELLKNVFTLDHCIFILAIDYEVVVKGLEPKFGNLTDHNEREFRSFFDKIIQVPFSLPVNNYRPMDFILKSLVDIGYLNEFDTTNPNVRSIFTTIVESSVGKNPRSIKRLINTLSLLDCIDSCGSTNKKETSLDEKILNFIVVAIQICYPKIYRMLSQKPGFTTWDAAFASKMGVSMDDEEDQGAVVDESKEQEVQWEDIIERVSSTDAFLSQHLNDVITLLNLILEVLSKTNQTSPEQVSEKMKKILDKSSVTGINSGLTNENFDKKTFMGKLHQNIINRIQELRPDIKKWQLKRNTGNGGIYIWYDDKNYINTTFTPSINAKNKITLRLWLHLEIKRPDRLKGKSYEEIMQEKPLADALAKLDELMVPLLDKKTWFFHGRTYEDNPTYFKSYRDELRYVIEMGWLPNHVANNPQFWVDLDKPSHFEEPQIIDTIAKVLIANHDFRKQLKDWQ
ncbi:MAG: hypothetical protein J1F38_07020 [Muribaculaceae bacterium]|nr:hypothetical protein [Muribaculaceae bacterium]